MKKNYLSASILFVLLILSELNAMSQGTVTVTDCNPNGWVRQQLPGTSLTLKNGIETPPLGLGSVEFATPASSYVRFRNTSYHNTLLSSLTALSYAAYVQNRENNFNDIYVVLLIDKNGDGRTDDNLVFDPRYQSGQYVVGKFPDQGLTTTGVWQTWDMLNGGWWIGPPPKPDPDMDQNALISLASYISENPDAKIINDPALGGGGIRFTAGAPPPIFAPNFIANLDAFTVGVNGVNTVYDFEFTTANAGADQQVVYGYGSNCSTLNGTAAGGVAPYSFSWVPGGSLPNAPGTVVCPTASTTYTLTVTDANGCSRTDDVTVFVNDVRCGEKMDKVKLCHNFMEICVDYIAVNAHLNHGDILGICNSLPSISMAGLSEIVPSEKTILTNFPNPFSSSTRIQYEVPFEGKVTLKVYDITGREVTTLVNGFKSTGIYTVNFTANGLGRGVYFYKLIAVSGNRFLTQTKQMRLIE